MCVCVHIIEAVSQVDFPWLYGIYRYAGNYSSVWFCGRSCSSINVLLFESAVRWPIFRREILSKKCRISRYTVILFIKTSSEFATSLQSPAEHFDVANIPSFVNIRVDGENKINSKDYQDLINNLYLYLSIYRNFISSFAGNFRFYFSLSPLPIIFAIYIIRFRMAPHPLKEHKIFFVSNQRLIYSQRTRAFCTKFKIELSILNM